MQHITKNTIKFSYSWTTAKIFIQWKEKKNRKASNIKIFTCSPTAIYSDEKKVKNWETKLTYCSLNTYNSKISIKYNKQMQAAFECKWMIKLDMK